MLPDLRCLSVGMKQRQKITADGPHCCVFSRPRIRRMLLVCLNYEGADCSTKSMRRKECKYIKSHIRKLETQRLLSPGMSLYASKSGSWRNKAGAYETRKANPCFPCPTGSRKILLRGYSSSPGVQMGLAR